MPVAKIVQDGSWLEEERARLEASSRANAEFEERHALGVARAAIALLAGLDREAQVAAYRSSVGRVMPGSQAALIVTDTLDYLERGWADQWTEDADAKRQAHPQVRREARELKIGDRNRGQISVPDLFPISCRTSGS